MSEMMNKITIDHDTCRALAQFCKRSNFDRVREFSENEEEAWRMLEALRVLRSELGRSGYNPR